MPIDVNGYSAQFNQFVQFAEQAGKSTAKAQVGGTAEGGALEGRTIVAKTRSDSIGNVGRLADSREINDVARDLFKRTVVDMFDGGGQDPRRRPGRAVFQERRNGAANHLPRHPLLGIWQRGASGAAGDRGDQGASQAFAARRRGARHVR